MATSARTQTRRYLFRQLFGAVEDFSDQWWDLIQSSLWFCDYWLQDCFSDPQIDSPFLDFTEADIIHNDDAVTKGKEMTMDLVALGWLKWRKLRRVEMPRCCEKAAKIVSVRVRVNPRSIHQLREDCVGFVTQ